MIAPTLASLILATAALLPCAPRLRALGAHRRAMLLALAAMIGWFAFWLLRDPLVAAMERSTALPFPLGPATAVATAAPLFAVGLAWSAILADSRRTSARWSVLLLGGLALALGLCSAHLGALVVVPLALRTGWARSLDRRWTTLAALLAGLAALVLWPSLPARGIGWPPGADGGLALAGMARLFLGVQLAVLTLRLTFGIMFGPRRIGRRLLVSHLVIGVLPVGLTGFFVVVTALLAIASLRASLAGRVLLLHHELTQELLVAQAARAVAVRDAGAIPASDAGDLVDLAVAIARDWPGAACWQPKEPPPGTVAPAPHLFLALSRAAPGDTVSSPRALLVEVARPAGRGDPEALGWILAAGRDSLRAWGDTARLGAIPAPAAWAGRPAVEGGTGLIKALGLTLHAADARVAGPGDSLRVQLIEELPHGRTRALERLLQASARIEERLHWSLAVEPGTGGTLVGLATDTLAVAAPGESRVSSYKSSYEMVVAQEWTPASGWQDLHLSVLGLSAVRDLILPMPHVSENPLALLPVVILFSAALLFVLTETLALYSVARTGRAIGEAVTALRGGAARLQRGDLSFRLETRGSDELAELGHSFNDMAHGLELGRADALERERLEGELALARQIQQRLLPTRPPEVTGCRLAGISLPARHVGGDYYDFICLPGDRLLFVLADVSGKGAPAALLMSSVRAALHSLPSSRERPAEIVSRLNAFVHASTSENEFVTLFVGLLEGCGGELTYVNAGHEQPFLIRAGGGIERLTASDLLLGVFPHAGYTDATAHLGPGDTLFLYTDGLSDAVNPQAEMFEEARVRAALERLGHRPAQELLSGMLGEVEAFSSGAEAADDITLVAVQRVAR